MIGVEAQYDPIDPKRYSRLRDMSVVRTIDWDSDALILHLVHKPTGCESRKMAIPRHDAMNYEAFLSAMISILAKELEVELKVYEKLEEMR